MLLFDSFLVLFQSKDRRQERQPSRVQPPALHDEHRGAQRAWQARQAGVRDRPRRGRKRKSGVLSEGGCFGVLRDQSV